MILGYKHFLILCNEVLCYSMYNNANKEFYSELEKILKTARLNYLNCNYHVMGFEPIRFTWGSYFIIYCFYNNLLN